MLKIKLVESDQRSAAIALIGRLDTNSSPDFEDWLNENAYKKGIENLTLDLGECEFVSSAGLRVFVAMQKKAFNADAKPTIFKNVPGEVMDVFQMTGLDNVFIIV